MKQASELKVELSKSSLGKYVVRISEDTFRFADNREILESWIADQVAAEKKVN